MVFQGRPSKACFACRVRRVKCDLNKSGCRQCSRMNISCPGYPDPLEQSYRDQSDAVMRKAEASYQKKTHRKITVALPWRSPSSSVTSPESDSSETSVAALCSNPSLHLDTIAFTEFMASYIPQSPYDYLQTIYIQKTPEDCLPANVRAVSVAMIACKLKDPSMLSIARQMYATAISQTNTALGDPKMALQDSTLVSVLLLGLFEALACQITGSSSNWSKHTRGALTLLQIRGRKQFRNDQGRRIFGHICSISNFDSIVRKAPLSQDLLGLILTAKQLQYDSPKLTFTQLMCEITQPPCVLWGCELPPMEIVSRAQRFDERIVAFAKGLPPDFEYQEIPQERHESLNSGWETYGHTIHQYQHHHAARMWNAVRSVRIMLNGAAHRALSQLPSSSQPKSKEHKLALRSAAQNINDAVVDICATVPQFLDAEKYDKVGIELTPEACVATLLSGLCIIKADPLAPQTARSYSTDRLKYLGRKFNVPQAEKAAKSGMGLDVLHSGYHMFYVY